MQVILNGNQENLDKTMSLCDFLLLKGLNAETIIVEYNGKIVKKNEWPDVVLQDHDRLEILKFVGGG